MQQNIPFGVVFEEEINKLTNSSFLWTASFLSYEWMKKGFVIITYKLETNSLKYDTFLYKKVYIF
jgi:hypothetical protein